MLAPEEKTQNQISRKREEKREREGKVYYFREWNEESFRGLLFYSLLTMLKQVHLMQALPEGVKVHGRDGNEYGRV